MEREVPEDILSTPDPEVDPDHPSGSWPRQVSKTLNETRKDVREIKEHLIGTVEKRGLVRRVEDLEKLSKIAIGIGIAFGTPITGFVAYAIWRAITAIPVPG